MPKQLLIYNDAKPVTKTSHADLYVKTGNDYTFAKDINSVPITAVEFSRAAQHFPIVFAGKGEDVISVVIMGARENENVFIDEDGKISSQYIPAFLRRYPFVFSSNDGGNQFTLCVDESFEGCNREGIGERIFDAQGEQTLYLKNILGFLKEYQSSFARTKLFCKKLIELDILEPMTAQFRPENSTHMTLSGFMAVNRQKLKALNGEQLQLLLRTDELELLFIHLQSMLNFNKMLEKRSGQESGESKLDRVKDEELVTS